MAERHARGGLPTLSALLVVSQVVDMAWPRAGSRAVLPTSVAFAVCLLFLRVPYPELPIRAESDKHRGSARRHAVRRGGDRRPDISARFAWLLPLAALLLALVIGAKFG